MAVLLALRLWMVLRCQAVGPRESLRLLVVAGSGKFKGGDCRFWVRHYKRDALTWSP